MAANNKNKGMLASAVNAVTDAASGVLETVGLAPAPAPAPAPNVYPVIGGKRKTRKASKKTSRKASKKAHRKASKKAHRKASKKASRKATRKSTRRHA